MPVPELPEISSYIWALEKLVHRKIAKSVLKSPFLLRSVRPALAEIENCAVEHISRIGKQIVIALDSDVHLIVHLMVNGRFKWFGEPVVPKTKSELLALQFDNGGTLMLTETGAKRQMSLHLISGGDNLADFDRGGVEVLDSEYADIRSALLKENHTLKRALTDPKLFSGIGNKYSDEILFCAGLSPLKWTSKLVNGEIEDLFYAAQVTLDNYIDGLKKQEKHGKKDGISFLPESRKGYFVYNRFREPCRQCETPIQRIRYANRSTHYCPVCQTGGKILADRSLSRILKKDRPKTLEEMEAVFPSFERSGEKNG